MTRLIVRAFPDWFLLMLGGFAIGAALLGQSLAG